MLLYIRTKFEQPYDVKFTFDKKIDNYFENPLRIVIRECVKETIEKDPDWIRWIPK